MPIKPSEFFNILIDNGVDFFTGVPDSLLKDICLYIDNNVSSNKHIIAANEGSAIALAAGYYLGKKSSLPLVYMQNSGFGNAVNPLLSLCDPEVYSIPMLVMIGWRGFPGVKDEPQHKKQGKVQLDLMKSMDFKYEILSHEIEESHNKILNLINYAKENNRPAFLLIKKGTFGKALGKNNKLYQEEMTRQDALEIILDIVGSNSPIISTTGKTSREIFEIRKKNNQPHDQDFLTVGSMGHCSSIALGISVAQPNTKVICIDGDGSMLMHLGSLTSIASLNPKNLLHILMNNKVHESVGGQETAAKNIDLLSIVSSLGTINTSKAINRTELKDELTALINFDGPSFLEVVIKPGSRKDLGRPDIKPIDIKDKFIRFLDK